MPFALVFIGLLMIVSGARNTHVQLGEQIVSDFTGPGNFTYWLIALGGVGSVGYITPLKPVSNAFLVLLLISFVLKNGGVFDKLNEAIQKGPISPSPGKSAMASDSAGIRVSDNSKNYVEGVAQTVREGMRLNAATSSNPLENFKAVANVAIKFFV